MSNVLKFPEKDCGFEFHTKIGFDGERWLFTVDSCFDMEPLGLFLGTIKEAVEQGGPINIRCEAPCECENHNP